MMGSTGKLKVESLILLSAISLLMSSCWVVAAPADSSASSSSDSASNEVPHPSSNMPAGSVSGIAKMDEASPNTGTRLSTDLHQLSSAATGPASVPAANNEIAHQIQEHAGASHHEETLNGVGDTSKLINGEKVAPFVEFPPFTKPVSTETRYQRHRRSYPMPSILPQDLQSGPSYHFSRPDEMELSLNDERDREAFLKLMSLIAAGENNRFDRDDLSSLLMKSDDEIPDERDDEIDLGAFQRPVGSPYWTSLDRTNEPINLMSSLLASDSPGVSSPYSGLPLDIALGPRGSLRDADDSGEWLEDSVPFRGSHMKTRRSDGNTEFTFNPVKSHFRRYLRALPLNIGGRFGAITNRRRRATSMRSGAIPSAMHWM